MTNHEFMQASERKMAQCWAKLMQRYNKVLPSPTLEFTLRGRAAGMHMGRSGIINLNLCFVAKNGDDMVNQTVPHEVVHAWLTKIGHPSHVRSYQSVQNDAYARLAGYRTRRSKRSPHGYEFMEVLGFLGCQEKRTHNYDTSDLQLKGQNRWAYKCPSCGKVFNVSTCIHNKMRHGQIRWCPPCGRERGTLVRAS